MPLQTPDEPKRYTAVYSDFRGVDFTNDPTNVWKRRSPTGLNMMPDMSGKPWKRTGWNIEIPKEKFIEIYCYKKQIESYNGTFNILKVYSFSLDGKDHLIIFTNLGIFSYTDYGVNFLRDRGDPARSFFFEGGAVAGFYIFEGYKLYRYDGYLLTEVTPYTPLVIIGRSPNGGGTVFESVNLINNKRMESFLGDSTSTEYYTTAPISNQDGVIVQVKNENGTYQTLVSGYSVKTYGITFEEAKPPVVEGEDNVLITYETGESIQQTKTLTAVASATNKKQNTTAVISGNTITAGTAWKWETQKIKLQSRSFVYDNNINVPLIKVFVRDRNDNWVVLGKEWYEITYAEYGAAFVDIKIHEDGFPGKVTNPFPRSLSCSVKIEYQELAFSTSEALMAFASCTTCAIYGTGLINSVFMSGTDYRNYSSRVWYSQTGDPTYFPDINYFEAGSTDTRIMGIVKVGEYLGIIKQGDTIDSTIYLAYPISFEDDAAYAVKQSVSGIGALSKSCFDVLGDETLFLSREGIMAIEPTGNENERQVRNRSFYVNKRLLDEFELERSFSFVWNGFYILSVNSHCYVLDGAQKSSWANEKTNLQYECYYWENVPATCFAEYDDELWFADKVGNLCRFKSEATDGMEAYSDNGAPILCEWSTILDNDGATNFYKNLQKKGCLVTIFPMEATGAKVYLRADDREPVLIGSISSENAMIPQEFYINKKVKKYKRLQIIVQNDNVNEGMGVQEIIKIYTMGNYSKNRSANNGP